MTTLTFHLIDRHIGTLEDPGLATGHHGLLRAGTVCLVVATLGVALGAFSANNALVSIAALVGVVGGFLLSCRELTGPQRVDLEPGAGQAPDRRGEHSVNCP